MDFDRCIVVGIKKFSKYKRNDNKISKLSSISVLNVFPNGVYCSEIDRDNNYLIIASFSKDSLNKKTTTCSKNGVSIWRFINSKPWLKNVFITDEVNAIVQF